MVSVCDRNSIAVELIRQGHHMQAQQVFRVGLETVATSINDDNTNNNASVTTPSTPTPSGLDRIPPISINQGVREDTGRSSDSDAAATFAMYKKAFLLGANERDEVILSLVLFYNMGLASHAMGVNTGRSNSLQRALRLYRKVYALLNEHGHGIPGVSLLLLATVNNMGHIFAMLLNLDGMVSCHANIQTILTGTDGAELSTSDLDFFFMTVVLGSTDQGRLPMAPAA
eukprot:CAMPEP_0168734212 /NCGR_PEP_ID=MMETSP0724-20121128/8694_1 /TAXON_ID=265536 /ORGANISM="Amphiprora sp., Strain CCMP467" /LENGTH=227 /DNA_ID=CAMNT_0008781303 /DNA_START=29 /DNA_END=712 /DNA_ORIENTATION=+